MISEVVNLLMRHQSLSGIKFRISFRANWMCCLLVLIFVVPAIGDEKKSDEVARHQTQFTKLVDPLIQQHCVGCHGSQKQEAKMDLSELVPSPDDADGVELWGSILEQLESKAMPPSDEVQPNAVLRQQAVTTIRDFLHLARPDLAFQDRLLLPEFGNRVSHALLFNGTIQTPPFTPARLWRMSPHVFRGKRYQLQTAGGIEAKPVAYTSRSSGIRDYADQEVMDESAFIMLKSALEDILSNQMHARQTFKVIVENSDAPTDETLLTVIRDEFQRATGRVAEASEEQRYLKFMHQNIEQAGNESGLRMTLLAIYLSTEAVYRFELGRGQKDQYGRRMLSPPEVAMALAYAFTDDPPARIAVLQQALNEGRLGTKSQIESVVRELIDSGAPPFRKELPAAFYARLVQSDDTPGYGWYPRVIRFFDEFFQYSKAAGTFKDSPGAGIGSRSLVADPLGYIAEIVNEDQHVFEELLTSSRFNENQEVLLARLERMYQDKLQRLPKSRHEGVKRWFNDGIKSGKKLRQETFRAGVLTDNSWLIAHSTNDENHPVHRGIWIRERLLAGNIPDLPIDVDASIPEGHDQTLRERHQVTRAEACWKCHRHFDPLGLPFESFDDRGWIRQAMYFDRDSNEYLPNPSLTEQELERLRKKSEIEVRPVDATGEISGTGEADVDGPVRDASELVHRLAKSDRVRQSIIRHAFRFWMGRNEMLSDSRTLIDADQAYVSSGGKFSEVLVSLLTSDSFLYRK